jgi:hypothetical protein
MSTGGQTDVTKLIEALYDCVKVPKNIHVSSVNSSQNYIQKIIK